MNRRSIELKDGRKLSYWYFGEKQTAPTLVYIHGFPSCGKEVAFCDKTAREYSIEIIAPDCPGAGLSDPAPEQSFVEWHHDIAELKDSLQITDYFLMGMSGGAPYALALAASDVENIKKLTIVSGLSPLERDSLREDRGKHHLNYVILRMTKLVPTLMRPVLIFIAFIWRLSPTFARQWMRLGLSASDRELLDRSTKGGGFSDEIRNHILCGLNQGAAAAADNFMRLTRSWDIPFDDIQCEVEWWHGEEDRYIPPPFHSNALQEIDRLHFRRVPSQGHLLMVRCANEILKAATPSGEPRYSSALELDDVSGPSHRERY